MTATTTTKAAPKIAPEVGMGATYGIGSDSYPCTVSKVTTDRDGQVTVIEIKRDDFRAAPGSDYYGKQEWIYTPRPDAHAETWKWDAKNERWRRAQANEKGRLVWAAPARGAGYLHVGERRARQDPSF